MPELVGDGAHAISTPSTTMLILACGTGYWLRSQYWLEAIRHSVPG
jgi:hypothetical protein